MITVSLNRKPTVLAAVYEGKYFQVLHEILQGYCYSIRKSTAENWKVVIKLLSNTLLVIFHQCYNFLISLSLTENQQLLKRLRFFHLSSGTLKWLLLTARIMWLFTWEYPPTSKGWNFDLTFLLPRRSLLHLGCKLMFLKHPPPNTLTFEIVAESFLYDFFREMLILTDLLSKKIWLWFP